MVDPNRKINRLTEKDIEFLDELEEEFKDRYSPDDEEFLKHCRVEIPPPPIVDPWNVDKSNFNYSGGRGGGGMNRYNNRDSGGGGGRFFNRGRNSRGGHFRHHPYNRSGHGSTGYRGRGGGFGGKEGRRDY